MGLGIDVGYLADIMENDPEGVEWFQEEMAVINKALEENGIPPHVEPTKLPELKSRCELISYPYSFLHYLRRFYARATNDPDWDPTPVRDGEDPSEDKIVDKQSNKFESHLLCHSDAEGYYLPIDFEDVIVDDDEEICGGLACSSYRLMEELVSIAPKLGIELSDGKLSDTEAQKINEESTTEASSFWIEKIVWLSLFEAARLSLEYKTAIRFG